MGELHFVLHLVGRDGLGTDGTGGADAGSAPCPIRVAARHLAVLKDEAGESTEGGFIGHLTASTSNPDD